MNEQLEHIVKEAARNNRLAQKNLYERFAPKMLAVAKSYTGNVQDAEDVIVGAFMKAFTRISECRDANAFPFWLRKIVVNDAISLIRKNKYVLYADSVEIEKVADEISEDSLEELTEINLEKLFQEMPLGYKLVFNLFVFEEKKHQEIAAMLNISENTSKSQYSKAKKWIIEFFNSETNEKFSKK